MANMSYCRFENTAADLDDCVDALREMRLINGKWCERYERRTGNEWVPVSVSEQEAIKHMVRLARNVVDTVNEVTRNS